jgi:hypothetical protein
MENREYQYDASVSVYYWGCENKLAGKSDESGLQIAATGLNFLKQLQQNHDVGWTVSPLSAEFTFTLFPLTHRPVTESNELFVSSVKSNWRLK